MIKAVYPGSFDPVTFGHLDIITRASKVVDELIIGVLVNQKKTPLFTMEERLQLLQEVTKDFPNVTVKAFEGLTVEFAKQNHARLIIRGLRAVTDFEYEMQLAQINHRVCILWLGHKQICTRGCNKSIKSKVSGCREHTRVEKSGEEDENMDCRSGRSAWMCAQRYVKAASAGR